MTPQNTPLEISEETSGLIGLPELVNERDQLKLRVEGLEKTSKELQDQNNQHSHDWKQLREQLGLDESTIDTILNHFESLQKQIVGLREALYSDIKERALLYLTVPTAAKVDFAMTKSTNFSHLYVHREVLEKLFQKWDCVYNLKWDQALQEFDEALTLARKELVE